MALATKATWYTNTDYSGTLGTEIITFENQFILKWKEKTVSYVYTER